MRRILTITALALLTATLLSGCLFKGAEALYQLPRLSEEYTNLQDEIEALIDSGLEYATPKSGDNTQAIQFQDLNGDGEAEVLAFLRDDSAEDGKTLYIRIYSKTDDLYQAVAQIGGEGSAFHSVEYVELDNDGITELVVNYQLADGVYSLAVYSLTNYNVSTMLQSGCIGYGVTDLDGDDISELILLQQDSTGEVGNRAEWYILSGGTLTLADSAPLSEATVSISRTRSSLLADGEAAFYITSTYSGGDKLLTDIIALRNGTLTNITMDDETGISLSTLRDNPGDSIFDTDINSDGIYEIPVATGLTDLGSSGLWQVAWLQYHLDGSSEAVMTAFCDTEDGDGWYIELPDSFWTKFSGWLLAKRTVSASNEEIAVTLYAWYGDQETEDVATVVGSDGTVLLKIYTLTGSNRAARAELTGRYTLYTGTDTIYAFALDTASGLTQAQVTEGFHLIPTTW